MIIQKNPWKHSCKNLSENSWRIILEEYLENPVKISQSLQIGRRTICKYHFENKSLLMYLSDHKCTVFNQRRQGNYVFIPSCIKCVNAINFFKSCLACDIQGDLAVEVEIRVR